MTVLNMVALWTAPIPSSIVCSLSPIRFVLTRKVRDFQDVSEFQHKLLDWLEEAFKSEASRAASPAQG